MFEMACVNSRGLLNRPRVLNTPVHLSPPREDLQDWATKREYPKPKVAKHMIKFFDDFSKLKLAERTDEWGDENFIHSHVAFAFPNPPHEPEEEDDDPGFPPGFPPSGVVAGGIIQVGAVTTLGQLMGQMGMPGGGGGAPHP
jgi:hypothetical protein